MRFFHLIILRRGQWRMLLNELDRMFERVNGLQRTVQVQSEQLRAVLKFGQLVIAHDPGTPPGWKVMTQEEHDALPKGFGSDTASLSAGPSIVYPSSRIGIN